LTIERFAVHVAPEVLDDLQHRLRLTRWPDDFSNEDWRYGATDSSSRPRSSVSTPNASSISTSSSVRVERADGDDLAGGGVGDVSREDGHAVAFWGFSMMSRTDLVAATTLVAVACTRSLSPLAQLSM
jgi:hypothetical protein